MSRLTFTSPPPFVLMMGDEGVLAIPPKGTDDAPLFAHEKDERAIDEIFSILARHPRAPVILFADNLAQDFRLESIPHLSLLDRPKLIERRLKQAFPEAGLTASLICGADRTQALLAGLHQGGPVFDWIERFKTRCPEHIPRIALVPVECSTMVAQLLPKAAEGWGMLLSRQRTGGFRQIVTHKGELVFTRLTPPLPYSARASELAEAVARDLKASLGYLGRLGLSNANDLHVALLMPDAMHVVFRTITLPVPDVKTLSPRQAALELGLPDAPAADEPYGDRLFAAWLIKKRKPRLPLTPPDLAQGRRTTIIREWGWRAAAAALLFAFVTTGWQAGGLFTTLQSVRQEAMQVADLKSRLAEEQATAAPITEPLGRLRQAIERRRLFSEPAAMPWTALRMLNSGLNSDVRLMKLDWHGADAKPLDETMQVELRFSGDAPKSNAERKAVVERFQKIAQNVAQAMPGYDVRLTRYPFPALPDEALSNSGDGKKTGDEDAMAEMTIRKVTP